MTPFTRLISIALFLTLSACSQAGRQFTNQFREFNEAGERRDIHTLLANLTAEKRNTYEGCFRNPACAKHFIVDIPAESVKDLSFSDFSLDDAMGYASAAYSGVTQKNGRQERVQGEVQFKRENNEWKIAGFTWGPKP